MNSRNEEVFEYFRRPIVYISLVSYGLKELDELEVMMNTRFLAVAGLVGVAAKVISLSTSFELS